LSPISTPCVPACPPVDREVYASTGSANPSDRPGIEIAAPSAAVACALSSAIIVSLTFEHCVEHRQMQRQPRLDIRRFGHAMRAAMRGALIVDVAQIRRLPAPG
jgi:hypothetical protein